MWLGISKARHAKCPGAGQHCLFVGCFVGYWYIWARSGMEMERTEGRLWAARLDFSIASLLLHFWGVFFLPPPAPEQRFKLNLYLSLQIEVLTKEKIGFSQNVFPSDSSQISKSCFSLGKLTSNSFLILPTTVTVRKAFLVDYIIIFFLTRSTLH